MCGRKLLELSKVGVFFESPLLRRAGMGLNEATRSQGPALKIAGEVAIFQAIPNETLRL